MVQLTSNPSVAPPARIKKPFRYVVSPTAAASVATADAFARLPDPLTSGTQADGQSLVRKTGRPCCDGSGIGHLTGLVPRSWPPCRRCQCWPHPKSGLSPAAGQPNPTGNRRLASTAL